MMRPALHALNARIVDLLPVARQRYYHPSQQGSWSIKSVLERQRLAYCHLDTWAMVRLWGAFTNTRLKA